MQRLEYTGRIADQMAGAVEHREHIGLGLSDRSKSLVKTRRSPQRKSPHRRERSPTRRRSPTRARSPKGASSSHRKSPPKEKVPDRIRSPTHVRERSPVRTSPSRSLSPRTKRSRRSQTEREPEKAKGGEHLKSSRGEQNRGGEGEFKEKRRTSSSHSPSPHSKRLMRAQAEREGEKIKSWEHGGDSSREGREGRNSRREIRDKGRYGEHDEARDALSERSSRDKNDGGSSRASRRDRPFSPEEHSHWSKHDSPSPSRASRAGRREELSKSRATEQFSDDDLDSVTKMKAAEESLEAKEKDKQKPSFELSGKLAEETNRVRGVTLLFNEPAEARKPDIRWRLYVFKAGEVLNEPLYVHRQSCYLFGRERRVADIPTDHPSCSKQHAVIQYRLVEKEQPDGLLLKQVRPYLMDLGSTNGTFINDNRIEAQRYYELFEKDTIRFGNSSREYVILHENSAT